MRGCQTDVAQATPRQQLLNSHISKSCNFEDIENIARLATPFAPDSFQISDMPDVVLPAIGFGIAAIGFLATVRSGIDLILRDKNHVDSSFVTDLVLVGTEITLLEDRLELWKTVWLMFEGTPPSQVIVFWGDSGAADIRRLLGVTEQISEGIKNQFQSMYGGVREDARNYLLESGLLEQDEPTSERHRQLMTKRLKDEYDKHVKLPKRIKLALFESPTFQSHLQTLKTSIIQLETLSTSKFERKNKFGYDEKAARDLSLQSALFDLAGAAQPISAFVIWCKQRCLPTTMAIDIQLDLAYGCGMEPRNTFLAQRAARDGYPYYLRLPNDASPKDGYLAVALTSEEEFLDLDQLIQTLATDPHGHDDPHAATNQPTQSSESLRKILLSSPKKLVESDYHPFSRLERYKLAYELSEVAMVLLSSDAFCQLCVCSIRRICLNTAMQDYEHFIRIKNAHELESSSQVVEDSDRWCKKEVLKMHILRLGIVLVEVSTGGVVKDAKYDKQSGEIKLALEIPGYPSEELKDCSLEKTALIVKEAGGEDLTWAVHYCLLRGVMTATTGEEDITLFFNKVVAP